MEGRESLQPGGCRGETKSGKIHIWREPVARSFGNPGTHSVSPVSGGYDPPSTPEIACMPTDADFLGKLLENPAEETTRLVYADWLDEQGDPLSKDKADFIRLESRMAILPEQSLNRLRYVKQLQRLASRVDPQWLAAVSHPRLEVCPVQFEFECPKQWAELTPTEDVRVRSCASCRRSVYYCETLSDARTQATAGDCVALSPALVRRLNDLSPSRPLAPGTIRLTPDMIARLPMAGILTVEDFVRPSEAGLGRPPAPDRNDRIQKRAAKARLTRIIHHAKNC